VADAALLLNDVEKEVPNRAAIERAGFCVVFSKRNHVHNVMWREGQKEKALRAFGLQLDVRPKKSATDLSKPPTKSRPGNSVRRAQLKAEAVSHKTASRAELRASRFLEANRRAKEIQEAKRRKVAS